MTAKPAPLVVLNGYPGVGKAAVASELQKLMPGSRMLDNHLLIDPVAAILERDDDGYRELRKAVRAPIWDAIATNTSLLPRTVITTYYQETFTDRTIDIKEFLECAEIGQRLFVVIILTCSPDENVKRLQENSRKSKSKLTDLTILDDILKNHFVYSFEADGYESYRVHEHRLDCTDTEAAETAQGILKIIRHLEDQVS